ncbi:hypothetical protein LFL96_29275 [Paraburkholderia sp. D15]|uniref:hypothetical protein n=1 Tax=Paraburkholderia sp. D15 TaxID=2880218 RepID=UPI00247A64B5|nr:hypothetical protein [Paraburkholderia sp. D15]WGS52292.1 hypothetical protein LFL96_29275 [Paraburkholderia sp. D15]
MIARRRAWALAAVVSLAVAASAPRVARADSDTDALSLADTATANTSAHRDWQASFEFAMGNYNQASQTTSAELADTARVSSLLSYDGSFAPGWRAVFSNRLDAGWRANVGQYNAIDTLKQAYLSWQPNSTTIVDAGRVNLREGVAQGFNPTDFFKTNAVRSIVSIDPASLRENRLGSVMLRSQVLWSGGSLSGLVSPKLASQPSNATFNPDFGATNNQTRYLLTLTQRLFGTVAPQWLLYGGDGISPQLGLNVTTLLGDATTGFIEYSGGRSPTFGAQPDSTDAFHSKLAAGFTHTFTNNLSLTVEYDYDGASADRATWNQLAFDPARYWQYRTAINDAQELMTRQALFSYATWQDALMRHLDLTAMLHYDLVDHSYSTWLEARYHWPRADVAIQWQTNHGASHSTYGADSQRQVLQALTTFFF